MATDSHFLDSAVYSTASCFAAASRSARAQLTLRVGRASSPKIPNCLAPAASLLSSTWAAVSRWSIFQTSPAAVARMSAEMAIDVFIGGSIEAFHVFRAAAFVIQVPMHSSSQTNRNSPPSNHPHRSAWRSHERGWRIGRRKHGTPVHAADPASQQAVRDRMARIFPCSEKECHASRGSGQKTSE